MIESVVETYFINQIAIHGGRAMKFLSPSMNGVPDQIVLYNGKTYYAELKAPKKKPRKSQLSVHALFLQHGIQVYTIDTKDKVDDFIQHTLQAKKIETPKETFEIKKNAFDI